MTSCLTPAAMEKNPCPLEMPLFRFGIIADIQYADIDDGYNFSQTRKRYYRSSLQLLRNALRSWSESVEKPEFILQLGDIINSSNKRAGVSEPALDAVLGEFSSCSAQVHHVWGNHEFYNFGRSGLLKSRLDSRLQVEMCGQPAREDIYAYCFCPFPGFLFVVLDAYDVSLLGRDKSSQEYKNAMNIIKLYNSNEDLNRPPASESRFNMSNGGFSKDQLDWLDSVLSSADGKQERVTVISHLPIHCGSADSVCLAWNCYELLDILRSHHSVVCYMAGHAHVGGYCQDKVTGVHHLTLDGVIEAPPDSDAFATVSVYKDRMVLEGSGQVESRVFMYP